MDFRNVPSAIAQEVRFVVGTKITRGDWTTNRRLLTTIRALLEAARRVEASSLFERDPGDWTRIIQSGPYQADNARDYIKTFFSTLHRTAVADPWSEDSWLWRDGFEVILGNPAGTCQPNIHWAPVSQPWLREPAKELARKSLLMGDRAWATIQNWARGLRDLSEYLSTEGLVEPAELDRELFLEYLMTAREQGASKNRLMSINTTASVLADLREGGYQPLLGSEIYLRRGENAVERAANPRPFPPDVIERIDRMLEFDGDLDEVVRVMLKFNRWGGLRISELVSLPIDCLRVNHSGGTWVEYYMEKTKSWRRFPLPEDLAQMMRAQQELVRGLYGDEAPFMFPSLNRSSRVAEVARPWSTSGLRSHSQRAFTRNGITSSSLTGEQIHGTSIHRFRHTIGTALLNADMTQAEVQEFLGHKSPTMTAHYARITDDTMSRKVREFYARQDAERPSPAEPQTHPGVERLRFKSASVLPGGRCLLPADGNCDFRVNPCLDNCPFFDPDQECFEATHANHRRMLELAIADSGSDPACREINRANLDALNRRVADVS